MSFVNISLIYISFVKNRIKKSSTGYSTLPIYNWIANENTYINKRSKKLHRFPSTQ